jgi:catechol 2,3-dioxygenase-like lactoylglutathione lyase family enzyme
MDFGEGPRVLLGPAGTRLERGGDMTIHLNHTIVAAHDRTATATFLTEILGLPAAIALGPFAVVRLDEHTSLDVMDSTSDIVSQHYAFLVSELEFDEIFARIRSRNIPYWADPYRKRRSEINGWDDGRGVYFEDPNGHLLEIITRPYGSGGTSASRPHPLIAPPLAREESVASDDDAARKGAGAPERGSK